MAEIITKIRKMGNSKGILIPAEVVEKLNLEENKIYKFDFEVEEIGELSKQEIKIKKLELALEHMKRKLRDGIPTNAKTGI